MTFSNVEEFAGRTVSPWSAGDELPTTVIPRIATAYDDAPPLLETLDALLATPGVENLEALSIGLFDPEAFEHDPQPIADHLIANAAQLPALRTLVWCDISYEECEVSWFDNIDVAPLLHAFPQLEHVLVRGQNELHFTDLRMPNLKTLVVQGGGLSADTVRELAAADLPALEHVELYLGDEGYGADTSLADVQPFLSAETFPKLTTLGLRNCEYTDEIAEAMPTAAVLPQLTVLDLSLGTLSDRGAAAIADHAEKFAHLEKIDLHHNYVADAALKGRLTQIFGDRINLDPDDAEEIDGSHYVAIGE